MRGSSICALAGVPNDLKGRSFTRVADWSRDELQTLLDLADELKAERARRPELRVLPGRTIGLIFHKPSTRTRVAFEVGIAELGGMALFLPAAELQLARGESYRDTALVLSRFLSALMIRTFDQAEVEEFAEHASIPVINGLTDDTHPLQALADAMTLRERFGQLAGLRIAYVGDGNNVCHSLMRIAARLGMDFVAATPAGYEPRADFVAAAAEDARANGGTVTVVTDPHEAAKARMPSTPMSGSRWVRTPSANSASATSSRTGSTIRCSRSPIAMQWRCTASRRTSARRSPPTSCTGRAASRGSRPRTGCTRRSR